MEEMKQAWEYYVQKDKSNFKPQFDFDDLATFDRALYNQISNPLVLRLFLETYHGKNLPKKGNQHLDIWSDWLASFTLQEQEFFTVLANAIWEKGENELLLDDVLKDNTLLPYFTNDQLNSPYPRLRNLGWISRYVKDLNACIGFTVEGALLHLLGKKLEKQEPSIKTSEIKQLLLTGSPLQQAGVSSFMQNLALQGDLKTVCELIDAGEEFIETCVTPIVLHLKINGVKETLDILLQNPTENDWKALLKVDANLEELTLYPLRKELAVQVIPRNNFSLKPAILLGLKEFRLIDKKDGESLFSKINLNQSDLRSDAQICNNLGDLFGHFGEYDNALEFYQQCLDIESKNLGNLHPVVANSYNSIGETWLEKGEFDKALVFLLQSLDIRLKTLGNHHFDVANSYTNIGSAWLEKGEYDKALEFNQQSLSIRLKTLGKQHPDVAHSYNALGAVWYRKGEYDKALKFLQQGLDIRLKTQGNQHPEVATSYNNIGFAWSNKGEYDKALKFHQQSLDIRVKTFGNLHPHVAISYNNIGVVWHSKGEYNKALEFHLQSLDIRLKSLGNLHPDVATSYFRIGSAWDSMCEYDKALDFYLQCLDIRLKTLGNQHPDIADSYDKIGNCQRELKMHQTAIQSFKAGFAIKKTARYPFQIAQCYEALSENQEALDYYIQTAKIRKENSDLGIEAESTQQSIKACIRLAKELGRERELPEWMIEISSKYIS